MTDKIVFVHVQKLERLCHVVALLNVSIAIHEVAVRLCDNVVFVVETVVANIMAQRRDKKRHRIDIVKLGIFAKVLRLQNIMAMLRDV